MRKPPDGEVFLFRVNPFNLENRGSISLLPAVMTELEKVFVLPQQQYRLFPMVFFSPGQPISVRQQTQKNKYL